MIGHRPRLVSGRASLRQLATVAALLAVFVIPGSARRAADLTPMAPLAAQGRAPRQPPPASGTKRRNTVAILTDGLPTPQSQPGRQAAATRIVLDLFPDVAV